MRLFFSVGEPSGDQHAAHLIHELKSRSPDIECVGYGGPAMAVAGCKLDFTLTDLAVMGIAKVLPLLGKFIGLARRAKRLMREQRPDAVILVDFPGFNWWIARAAKKLGIPVIYYCPPQLWAWAGWRIHKMRRLVDHLLCCLPFETEWFRSRGMSADCVGHPFFDEVRDRKLDDGFLSLHKSRPGRQVVGILPGSRNQEVRGNWPIQLQVIRNLHAKFPETRFIVACFKPAHREFCESTLAQHPELPIELCIGKTSEIIETADCCLMVSGSVSLEVLARATPATVLYQCGRLFYALARTLARIDHMSLPNLIANRSLMPEFAVVGNPSNDITKMTEILSNWLSQPEELERKRNELQNLRREVAHPGATARAADYLLNHMGVKRPADRHAA